MAAIVLETGVSKKVVCLATGSKCVGEAFRDSWTVVDNHSEVLALRLFKVFLANEVEKLLSNIESKDSFLEKKSQENTSVPMFTIKEAVKFHFFTSCVPCGDATISEKKDYLQFQSAVCVIGSKNQTLISKLALKNPRKRVSEFKHLEPSKLKRFCTEESIDVNRTGAKSCLDQKLSGAEYHETCVVRTKPGRGPKSLSLSCSDKLMKRIWLGFQGGVMSQFVDPIFPTSIVVGGNCSIESVSRALVLRVTSQSDYQRNLELYVVPDSFIDSKTIKITFDNPEPTAAGGSILWCAGSNPITECCVKGKRSGATKKTPQAKSTLFISRRSILQKLKPLLPKSDKLVTSELNEECFISHYNAIKSDVYQERKHRFCSGFLGWNRKDTKLATL